MAELYCPLLAIVAQAHPEGARQQTLCLQTHCAWWYAETEACAVLALSAVLDHHLANIAGNTARIGG